MCIVQQQRIKTYQRTNQPAKLGSREIPRTSHSNVPRMPPKNLTWPSQGCPNVTTCESPTNVLGRHSQDVPQKTSKTRLQDIVRSSAECP